MDTMMSLTHKHKETRDRESNSKLCQEIEKPEAEYSTVQHQTQEVLVEIKEIANRKVTEWFYVIITQWHCSVYRILKKLW